MIVSGECSKVMKTVSVRLEWREEGEEVDSAEVAGDFNQWEKVPLFLQCEEDDSVWWTMLEVMPGGYSYKFLIDGEWKNAPGAEVEENEDGELVSVLIVEEEEDGVEEENGESCKEEKATISGERRESVKAENNLEERGQRRAAVGTN